MFGPKLSNLWNDALVEARHSICHGHEQIALEVSKWPASSCEELRQLELVSFFLFLFFV